MRRRTFGERLKKELIGLAVSLVFVVIAVYLALYVFPDILAGMFSDATNIQSPRPGQ